MRKSFEIICVLLGVFISLNAYAFPTFTKKQPAQTQIPPQTQEQKLDTVELDVNENDKLKIEKNEPVKKIDSDVMPNSEEERIKAFQIQRKHDIEDISALWKATVERNNVIKFALKKITMNPEERKKHSSKMARTISALINGSTILPYMFGIDSSIASAIAASTSMAAQATRNRMGYGPQNIPVTDTELIQLASLIEDLQNNLIKNYYSYKSSIELLKDCRSKLAVYKKNYNQALETKDAANILVTKSLYDKQELEELKLKNQIKAARLELERFAGEETVNNLNLANSNEIKTSENTQGGQL